MPELEFSGSAGVAFIVAGTCVADIIAKACSSPQTAEININKRADTLMKWVFIGMVEAVVFIFIAAAIDKKYRGAILAGGLLELVITYLEYAHAKAAGLNSAEVMTET